MARKLKYSSNISKCFKRRRIEISTIPLLKFLYAYFMSRLLYF